MQKLKILFLSSRLPYPPIGGDRLKNYWLLKILSNHFKVHLVSLAEKKVPKEFYEWANSLNITYKIFRKRKISYIINLLKAFLNNWPFQVNYFYFKDVQKYINTIYKKYDLIFATLIRTAPYVINKNMPKIIDIADSIGLHYKNALSKTRSLKWKLIYLLETKRLLNYEQMCINRFNKSLFFNKFEKEYFKNKDKTAWMPHGVSEDLFKYTKQSKKYSNCIVFFGKMNYQPNIDAVLWFVKNVLPKLNKELKVYIVGAYPSEKIKNLEKKYKNIIVTGFVKDPYEIIKSSLCVVAPMQTGGGIQNKILESMALGTINIMSSLAAKPIGARHKKEIILADDPKKMAYFINDIFKNPKKYEYLKDNSKKFIAKNFTWSIYEKNIIKIIKEVVQNTKTNFLPGQ